MSGGAGHVADMNNRMKQNRSMKTSYKSEFKSNFRSQNYSKESKGLIFNKVSQEELTRIKTGIKNRAALERKKERLLIVFIVIIFIIFMTFLLI